MAACWTIRGMRKRFKQLTTTARTRCSAAAARSTASSATRRPQHKQASALDLLEPTVDRSAKRKYCLTCEFYLQHGPRKDPEAPAVEVSDPTAMTYRDHANPGDRW